MNGLTAIVFFSALAAAPAVGTNKTDNFQWQGASVYFVITDRFCNGDSTNDVNYGRIVDYGSERLNAATFHGGDFAGMLQKARDGYFTDMGIDVVWMTDVYEQIHGWMSGSGSVNDFPHYGYHGYYPLDYTQTDKNYGTVGEFRELVDCLHSQNIRVMLGANLNDPGYPTLLDAVQYGFAPTGRMTERDAALHHRDWNYDEWSADCHNWDKWWTRDWIRMTDENWDPTDPLTVTLYGMPDFKTEKDDPVGIPSFLTEKWAKEGHDNDRWVNPSARPLRDNSRKQSPTQHLIGWIASWVEEFGIDGFRCDIVEYVHLNRWKELYDACDKALDRWRARHSGDPASQWDEHFYMTGDFEFASVDYKADYADAGFSSMVNCDFPKRGDLDGIVYTWQAYADSLQAHNDWHPFSYLNNSYNRDADMDNMLNCATTLLLSPGAIQTFYGDETGRKLSEARFNVDSNQAFRSDMDWNDIDSTLLNHYRRLGTIRHKHPAIGAGSQKSIDNHTCARTCGSDTVVITVRPVPDQPINVGGFFPDGTILTELYSGQQAAVNDGTVRFGTYLNDIAVLAKTPAVGQSKDSTYPNKSVER